MIDLLLKEQGAGTRISTPAGNSGPLGARIWIAAGVTDMRRGFQGLAAQVQTALEQQPYSGHIFIFGSDRAILCRTRAACACTGGEVLRSQCVPKASFC